MTEKIEKLKQILSEAKIVVIGAGSGLSTSENGLKNIFQILQ